MMAQHDGKAIKVHSEGNVCVQNFIKMHPIVVGKSRITKVIRSHRLRKADAEIQQTDPDIAIPKSVPLL